MFRTKVLKDVYITAGRGLKYFNINVKQVLNFVVVVVFLNSCEESSRAFSCEDSPEGCLLHGKDDVEVFYIIAKKS